MKFACLYFSKSFGPLHVHEGKGCYVDVRKLFQLFKPEKKILMMS